jgi:hypothetical protein
MHLPLHHTGGWQQQLCSRHLKRLLPVLQMISAYLMATEGLTVEQTIASIRQARPIIHPNSGFLMQLQLFHEMGCKLDPQYEGYRLHKMEKLGEQWWKQKSVETDSLAQVSEAPDLQVSSVVRHVNKSCPACHVNSRQQGYGTWLHLPFMYALLTASLISLSF